MCVLWYHRCLSAPPSHALSEGDAPVPLWSITLAGRTETHALSAVCTTPSLLYCLPICPSACCYKQSHHFQCQSEAGSQVRKREKQVPPIHPLECSCLLHQLPPALDACPGCPRQAWEEILGINTILRVSLQLITLMERFSGHFPSFFS